MPGSRFLIESQVLTTSAASVTFSAIPATYTDLVIKTSLRHNAASTQDTFLITAINGATGFSNIWIRGDGASVISSSATPSSASYVGQIPGATATSDTFDNTEIYIPSYTASQNKPFSTFSVQENNATTAYMGVTAGLWSNTAAITSIAFSANGQSFVSGSSFYLYGISSTV
jgi:hypothetical protein